MLLLKNTVSKFFVLICLFFYLYSVPLSFIPLHVGSRVVLAVAGFFILIFHLAKQAGIRKDILIKKDILIYAGIFALLIFFSLTAIFLNGTKDLEFVTYPVSLSLILLAAYFIHFIVKKTNRIAFIDEDVPGGAAAYMFNKVMEEQDGYKWLDVSPRTLTAKDHRPSYGSDGDYFSKPNVEDVIKVAKEIMAE